MRIRICKPFKAQKSPNRNKLIHQQRICITFKNSKISKWQHADSLTPKFSATLSENEIEMQQLYADKNNDNHFLERDKRIIPVGGFREKVGEKKKSATQQATTILIVHQFRCRCVQWFFMVTEQQEEKQKHPCYPNGSSQSQYGTKREPAGLVGKSRKRRL